MAVQSDMLAAIYQIADERGLEKDQVMGILKDAVLAAYHKSYGDGGEEVAEHLSVEIDEDNGQFSVFAERTVVDKVKDEDHEVSLAESQEMDKTLKSGDQVLVDITPDDFGRIAAQAARMKIIQDVREAETDAQLAKLKDRIGQIVTGVVQRPIRGGVIEVEVDRAPCWMPEEEQIPREFYKSGERLRFLLKGIREIDSVNRAIVSRGDDEFLLKLFETEIPEINSEAVVIKGMAREAGARTKVAVYSMQEKIDPIGACVGPRGARITAISEELGMREKIDIIVWDEDPAVFIKNALQPATSIDVKVNEDGEHAVVLVDEDTLSLAIGKEGQNARLAAKLTGFKIDITDSAKDFKQMKGKSASDVLGEDESGVADKATEGKTKKKETKKPEEKAKFVCEKCGKEYKLEGYYKKHVKKCKTKAKASKKGEKK